MIYFKIIVLFLSSFWCTTFIFLLLHCILSSHGKEIIWFLFKLVFTCVFRLYFPVFSQMLSVILKELKFYCIRFCFVLWSWKLTQFCVFNFLCFCRPAKKKKISCFLISFTHQFEFFLLIYFNILALHLFNFK